MYCSCSSYIFLNIITTRNVVITSTATANSDTLIKEAKKTESLWKPNAQLRLSLLILSLPICDIQDEQAQEMTVHVDTWKMLRSVEAQPSSG